MAKPATAEKSDLTARSRQEAIWRGLLARIGAGDQSALSAFFDGSKELVYALALRILGDEADAEEVTLDVYIQVWRTAGAYNSSRGSVTAWLVVLARSRALDRWRARSGRLQKELPLPEQFDPAAGPDPEGEAEDAQRRRRVAAAIATLPAEQRQLLQLAFFSGMTHTEMAQHLRQPLGTVKSRIRTGMMRLREALEPLSA